MANTSILYFITIIAIAATKDVLIGHNLQGRKIFDKEVTAGPAIWRQVQNLTINATDSEVISRINITDLRPEKDGAAKIVDGGVGLQDVTIELESPTVLRGYSFYVEVYSVPKTSEDGKAVLNEQNTDMGNDKNNQPRSFSQPGDKHNFGLETNLDSSTNVAAKDPNNATESADGLITNADTTRTTRDTEDKDINVPKQFAETEKTASITTSTASYKTIDVSSVPYLTTPRDVKYNTKTENSDGISRDESNVSDQNKKTSDKSEISSIVVSTDDIKVNDGSFRKARSMEDSNVSTSTIIPIGKDLEVNSDVPRKITENVTKSEHEDDHLNNTKHVNVDEAVTDEDDIINPYPYNPVALSQFTTEKVHETTAENKNEQKRDTIETKNGKPLNEAKSSQVSERANPNRMPYLKPVVSLE